MVARALSSPPPWLAGLAFAGSTVGSAGAGASGLSREMLREHLRMDGHSVSPFWDCEMKGREHAEASPL